MTVQITPSEFRKLGNRFVFQGGSEFGNSIADALERLTAENLRLAGEVSKHALERLTGELQDVRGHYERAAKERDALKLIANEHWDRRLANAEIVAALTVERDALKAALQLIKANTNTADWPDDINAAIQGEQP